MVQRPAITVRRLSAPTTHHPLITGAALQPGPHPSLPPRGHLAGHGWGHLVPRHQLCKTSRCPHTPPARLDAPAGPPLRWRGPARSMRPRAALRNSLSPRVWRVILLGIGMLRMAAELAIIRPWSLPTWQHASSLQTKRHPCISSMSQSRQEHAQASL